MLQGNFERRETRDEKNLSAQKTPQTESTRLPRKNGYQKRPQSSRSKKSQRQKTPQLLINLMRIISIKRNNDFLRLYRRGRSAADSHFICYVAPNRLGKVRLGITTSKKIGKAVARNRARRVLRAAFREVLPKIREGQDIILVARTKTTFSKSTALTPILTAQLGKLGALQSTKEV